ncbi:hypothetical protein [Hymenobacter cellulosivorans]|uniref:Lipoprotein n=1 Tax=Hymenobacter cellulosivorans TaxID=2932249 RepID=A0ABY4F5U1_9BACT|nr:hypothetical protein [Hymenobacter cellulosivorans]UOQ52026.1 hypothetical protein MUN80_19960 [Hymenobacter cellulosivorans]
MRLLTTITAASVLVSLLASCQSNSSSKDQDPTPTAAQGYLKVNFDGQTKVYSDARISVGQMGSIKSLTITAGSTSKDYLTISVFGSTPGNYPYRTDLNIYEQVSQVEYQIHDTKFNNYKALLCPTTSDYYSTTGQVQLTEYVAGKRAKGTFSGELLDQNAEDECSKAGKSFSGEFSVVAP